MRRRGRSSAVLAASIVAIACTQTLVVRHGPAQRQIVARTYARTTRELRAAILDRYPKPNAAFKRDTISPDLFHVLSITEQPPPGFSADWLASYVDPGGYLEPYRRLPVAEQANDLALTEWVGDRYWTSEYEANGRSVRFRCWFVLHFAEPTPGTTELQVFEIVPTVWVGEHWAWAKEGFGPGRFHDIRFVEPTVKDREAILQFVDSILK